MLVFTLDRIIHWSKANGIGIIVLHYVCLWKLVSDECNYKLGTTIYGKC